MRESVDPDEITESQASAPNVNNAEQSCVDSSPARNGVEYPDQARSQLIAKLVHDLGTPLLSIRGYTKMILDERAGPISSTQREYLTIAAENANHIIRLVRDLQRLYASQTPHFEMLDAREIWHAILGIARPIALQKAIRVKESIPDAPLMIFGDKQELREVFTNLIFNSIKFTDRDGEVAVDLSGSSTGEVQIKISDTGVGIPAEVLDESFRLSPEAENSSSTIRDSLRVGLLVVQDIIRLHGGQISVSSRSGGGVTFLITLPAF